MALDANAQPSDDSRRVRDLFGRVIDLPREQWPTFLERECADLRVRGEVERLLLHHNPTQDDFLESPAATVRAAAVVTWADSLIGRRLGQYTLLRLIAAGGMGCVFEARQEHPARDVAVKVLPPGISASSALARFRLEPELLARLQHPNIAQVFESGVHESDLGPTPFFAMELIRGAVSIVDYATAASLDSRTRLEMFAKVCDAVHHGHQKGVIHRDLKPANILVGADGEPKVIDFGIARATDADVLVTTQQTHVGDLVGTVRYMSPEQCDGDSSRIDTRSDVYSLGVVLYELLTGQAPYETTGTTIYSAVRMIKDDAPRQPSAHVRSLHGNVDAILLKALEKDPARRYGSAADLARDIRRHLAHEPIEARPPGPLARGLSWIRRHPLIASGISSAAMVAFALTGAVLTYWYVTTRPARVTVSEDESVARLETAIGYPLRTWPAGIIEIGFGEFAERPAALGGGPLAIVGFRFGQSPFAGRICVFDLRKSFDVPAATWGLAESEIPRDEIIQQRGKDDRPLTPDEFGPDIGILADVFDDPPGVVAQELICFIKHKDVTHGALCVFRLDGKCLYRIWIDADLDTLWWSPGPGVIVCSGVNGEAFTAEREIDNPTPTVWHPRVFFGIRPTLGTLLDKYLVQEPSERENAPAERPRPLWYHCVLPLDKNHPQSYNRIRRVGPPEPPHDRDSAVCVYVTVAPSGSDIPAKFVSGVKKWVLDAASGDVIETDSINEHYQLYERTPEKPDGDFPPYDSWYLGELPPKKKRATSSPPSGVTVP